jgi:hypothetical protein
MDSMKRDGSITLRGLTHPRSYFQIVENEGIDWQLWVDVVCGDIAGAMFRRTLEPELCEQICHNFWHSPALKRQSDGLPAHARAFVGASLGTPPLESYFEQVARMRPYLDGLFAGTGGLYNELLGNISKHLAERGYSLRLAEYNGHQAAKFKMRSRLNTGGFVIVPHDDFGLLTAPHLRDFEVGQVDRVLNVVICLENGEGGELQYWNICPNDETREVLGFKSPSARYDSFGYPLEALADFEKITMPIRAGDMYLFDVSNVHAVGHKKDDRVKRTTLIWSTGLRDTATALYAARQSSASCNA